VNAKQIMQALLDGKKVVGTAAEWVCLSGDRLINCAGMELTHLCVIGAELYVEPNPHKPGTFAWKQAIESGEEP